MFLRRSSARSSSVKPFCESSEACRRSCSLVQPAATSNYNRDSSESRGEKTFPLLLGFCAGVIFLPRVSLVEHPQGFIGRSRMAVGHLVCFSITPGTKIRHKEKIEISLFDPWNTLLVDFEESVCFFFQNLSGKVGRAVFPPNSHPTF